MPTGKTPPISPPAKSAPPTTLHDLGQQVRNLRQVLQDDKVRLGCFFGAGCPLGIYDQEGKASLKLIPAVEQLTDQVAEALGARDKAAGKSSKLRGQWDEFFKECEDEGRKPTVEDVLTEVRTFIYRRGKSAVLGMTKEDCSTLDSVICEVIAEVVKETLPSHRCSYNRFASWLAGIHRMFPVEVFTPNYDLLFEQAFEQQSHPHFDGFVGSREPWFDLASIEHDAIPSRWTRLWKLHGSINWEQIKEANGAKDRLRVVRVSRAAKTGQVMIYPSHIKYDQSRRMPYLAMLDRLRAFFRGDPSRRRAGLDIHDEGAPRLVVCGYSFLDDHLNEVILDGLRGNRKSQCFALMYSGLAKHERVVEYAKSHANLTVLAYDGGVVGTRVGRFKAEKPVIEENSPWIEEDDSTTSSFGLPCRSRLGDFHFFNLFLEQLTGGSQHNVV